MRVYVIILSILIFVGCSSSQPKTQKEHKKETHLYSDEIYDLKNIPQTAKTFTKDINFTQMSYINQGEYEKSYFSPWNMQSVSVPLESAKWPFKSFTPQKSYGENLQLLSQEFFDEMLKESNYNEYASVNKNAITLKYTNIRAFPTSKPLLLDPTQAGEGFPFDYLQNSSIAANKPIFVSHFSKTKEWAFIFSSFTYGWIKATDLVYIEKTYTDSWQKAEQVFITKEGSAIYTEDGKFLFNSRIGTMLALIDESEEFYTVLSVSSSELLRPKYQKSKISKSIANKNTLTFNAKNLENIIGEISKSKYGWGGIYEQRDCSSMLRDLFSPFGVWLPRNSYQQSKVGKKISLAGTNNAQKIAIIKENALPFKTLLYKKGHIMLYVGSYDDEIVVLHDTWGIKTIKNEKEGRRIIGKTIFSTLHLGSHQEFYDEKSELLRNLKSINILNY